MEMRPSSAPRDIRADIRDAVMEALVELDSKTIDFGTWNDAQSNGDVDIANALQPFDVRVGGLTDDFMDEIAPAIERLREQYDAELVSFLQAHPAIPTADALSR